jgi:hypothetical protein
MRVAGLERLCVGAQPVLSMDERDHLIVPVDQPLDVGLHLAPAANPVA